MSALVAVVLYCESQYICPCGCGSVSVYGRRSICLSVLLLLLLYVHGLSIIVSGIRPLYVRSIARSWCQDCACHLTAVLYCCGVSSSCEV